MWPVSLVKHVAANTDTHLKKTINHTNKQKNALVFITFIKASNTPCRLLQIMARSYRESDDQIITAFLFLAQN